MSALFSAAWFLILRRTVIRIVLGFFILSILSVLFFKWVNPPTTINMLGQRISKGSALERKWKAIDEISPNMQLAVICGEDQQFNSHFGFDFGALKSAAVHNAKGGKIRGASTISQQTAKNVFLWNGGGYIRKGLEAWFTLLIETIWGKKRIMEVYLNVAETGNGTFGVEAAANRYFHTTAKKLNRGQAAAISSILPSPRKWKIGTQPAARRQSLILTAMNRYGIQLEYLK